MLRKMKGISGGIAHYLMGTVYVMGQLLTHERRMRRGR